jgi:hypothetical protein
MFRHPKYYKELRDAGNELAKRNAVKEDLACSGSSPARNKSDQAISKRQPTGESERASWSGATSKSQASSDKHQAASVKLSNQPVQVSSDKHPNHNHKRQASSPK